MRLKSTALKDLVSQWIDQLPPEARSKTYAIDGKEVRAAGKVGARIQMVGLYATDSGVLITSEKVPEKRSEPLALPALLKAVDIAGAIVTMDAAYAHAKDLKEVTEKRTDYIVAIKGNQPILHGEVVSFFSRPTPPARPTRPSTST